MAKLAAFSRKHPTLRSLLRSRKFRFGIGVQFFLALGGAVALILLTSLVGLLSLTQVADSQRQVNQESMPAMRAAFRIAQESSTLVAATPRLMSVTDEAQYQTVSAEVTKGMQDFKVALAELDPARPMAQGFETVQQLGDGLILNIEELNVEVAQQLELQRQHRSIAAALANAQRQLDEILNAMIDDQLFFLTTGRRELDEPPASDARRQSLQELLSYRWLQTLRAETINAATLIENALNQSDAAYLQPIRERYAATVRTIETSLEGIASQSNRDALAEAVARLLAYGEGAQGGFEVRSRELELVADMEQHLLESRTLALRLGSEVEQLAASSSDLAQTASMRTEDTVRLGQSLLVVLNLFSLAGALLIAWLYVGRVLLHRIGELSRAMLRMADGDLEAPLQIKGRDEVTEMARALEVFRKNALEVQRLNLVEKLAEEVRSKNTELERVLEELQKAQDQIVLREKLAALGELTAGVAHEIKNPLNFVNNFSQISIELIDELRELLEGADSLGEEKRTQIGDIFDDLSTNLGKINEHGKRADSIVRGMLRHGRSGGDLEPSDLNAMLLECARLAYHSARASNTDFNVTLHEDLAPDMGLVDLVPQDWSRVLLNLITNACDATDEQRRKEGSGSYEPGIWLITRRSGDEVEIRIRDNGTGIPDALREKIFNPFFTTKPTDKGTGLGLSLSHDIVQQHRGELRVESETGKYTEMIITLLASREAAGEEMPKSV